MKKQAFGVIVALFLFAVLLPMGAYAADNVYAILYEDGELVFQNGNAPETGREVKKTYEVDLTAVYDWDSFAPWYNERESVRVVLFTDKVSPTSTALWFYECKNLERVENIKNLNTANVINMSFMFSGCNALTALDVSHFDTSNVTNMSDMFYDCTSLKTLDVSHFDTANVTNMGGMFSACSGLTTLDVSNFNTANVTEMNAIFRRCTSLRTIYASDKFTTASIIYQDLDGSMFMDCTVLVGGNGTKYTYWDNHPFYFDTRYARIDTASAPGYFTYKPFTTNVYAIADAVTGDGNGLLSVIFSNPDAATLAVMYFTENGRFVSADLQAVQADAGTAESSVPANAKTARVILLNHACRPLCAPLPADV